MADKNERAPMWTVLGVPAEDKDKACWVAYFEDKKAYWEEHKNAQEIGMKDGSRTDVNAAFKAHGLHDDMMMNMGGGYMGPMWHLEGKSNTPLASALIVKKHGDNEADAKKILENAK